MAVKITTLTKKKPALVISYKSTEDRFIFKETY